MSAPVSILRSAGRTGGWGTIRADFEEHDQAIRQLAARGLTYGVHLVLTAACWSDVHSTTSPASRT